MQISKGLYRVGADPSGRRRIPSVTAPQYRPAPEIPGQQPLVTAHPRLAAVTQALVTPHLPGPDDTSGRRADPGC
jgi:hypothetical protein